KRRRQEAISYWKQAYTHFGNLAREQPHDPLMRLNLGLCCCRLTEKQQANSYYAEAVEMFEQAARTLAERFQQDPNEDWPHLALLEVYSSLAVCHWKAGQTALADQTFQEHVRPLVAGISEHRADQRLDLDGMAQLVRAVLALED